MTPHRPDPIAYLTGRLSETPRPPGISLPGGGGKFFSDGAVQPWPGNTFICHIDPGSIAFSAIRRIQEEIKMSRFARFYTFLPPSSFHMTVFQGISPVTPPGRGWPDDLPTDLERDDVTREIIRRVQSAEVSPVHVVRVTDVFAGHSLTATGANADEEASLRAARVSLRQATGMRQADFDAYVFHISLAYLIDWVSESVARDIVAFSADLTTRLCPEIGDIALGPIEFCTFNDMHHFEPVALLGTMEIPGRRHVR